MSTAEGEKLTLQQEKAALAESLSEAKQEAEAFAAKGRQTAEDVCRYQPLPPFLPSAL